jgi:hypothetical protein
MADEDLKSEWMDMRAQMLLRVENKNILYLGRCNVCHAWCDGGVSVASVLTDRFRIRVCSLSCKNAYEVSRELHL